MWPSPERAATTCIHGHRSRWPEVRGMHGPDRLDHPHRRHQQPGRDRTALGRCVGEATVTPWPSTSTRAASDACRHRTRWECRHSGRRSVIPASGPCSGCRLPAPSVVVADLVAYEQENNPDGVEPDSNPFGLAFDGFDALVADAGGNDLLRVDAGRDASRSRRSSPTPWWSATVHSRPGPIPMQAVPTSVEVDADGDIHVGQLTGFPFEVGAANICSVSGGTATA